MNRQEHLLTILAEECAELQQIICKALRFGVHESRDLPEKNDQRMFKEFNDFLAMVDMFNESVMATSFKKSSVTYGPRGVMYRDEEFIRSKRVKVEKYLEYSKECGTLTD